MTMDAEHLADRRALRRRLSGWRIVALVAVIGALLAGGMAAFRDEAIPGQAHIAKVSISGLVTGDSRTVDLLRKVGESRASAVLLMINSPGGTTSGAEEIYDAVRRLSQKKPTVAVIDNLGASGAYIVALGTDRIVARRTALVGSIGVIMQYPNFVGLLNSIGVKVEEIKSSPLKAAPSSFEPTTPEARAAMESLIQDTYAWFKGLVKERRAYDDAQLAAVADGRVFTGHQALGLKLIDQIGSERDAIAWLERAKGVAKDLPVRRWRRERSTFGGFTSLAGLASALGYEQLAHLIGRVSLESEAAQLDGMLALWHGRIEK